MCGGEWKSFSRREPQFKTANLSEQILLLAATTPTREDFGQPHCGVSCGSHNHSSSFLFFRLCYNDSSTAFPYSGVPSNGTRPFPFPITGFCSSNRNFPPAFFTFTRNQSPLFSPSPRWFSSSPLGAPSILILPASFRHHLPRTDEFTQLVGLWNALQLVNPA